MKRDLLPMLATAAVVGATKSIWKGMAVGVVAALVLKKVGVPEEIGEGIPGLSALAGLLRRQIDTEE